MLKSLSEISPAQFEQVVPHNERLRVAAAYDRVLQQHKDELNYNYFKAPQLYDPYTSHVGPINQNLTLLPDLSRCNMSAVYFLNQLSGDHIVVDYACGMSGLIHYASQRFQAYGFDRWVQIPRHCAAAFLRELGHSVDRLIDYEQIAQVQPTIINVAGFWLEDIELYSLPSLKYVVSDTLYNSGLVPGEGVFFYQPGWQHTPECMGLRKVFQFPGIDIYEVPRS